MHMCRRTGRHPDALSSPQLLPRHHVPLSINSGFCSRCVGIARIGHVSSVTALPVGLSATHLPLMYLTNYIGLETKLETES